MNAKEEKGDKMMANSVYWVIYDDQLGTPSKWNSESQAANHAKELRRRGAKNLRIGNNHNLTLRSVGADEQGRILTGSL